MFALGSTAWLLSSMANLENKLKACTLNPKLNPKLNPETETVPHDPSLPLGKPGEQDAQGPST
jgi:hypothetical protein